MTTFSTLHLASQCPASSVIAGVEEPESEAMERGSALHAFLERVAMRRSSPDVRDADLDSARATALAEFGDSDYLSAMRAIDLDSLESTSLAGEVAFAWNWRTRTGREIGRNLHRRYHAVTPAIDWSTEIPGTLDVLGLDSDRVVLVRDYKTGRTRYPRPGEYLQTVVGALAAASVYGASQAVVELCYLGDDGLPYVVRDELDEWDLQAAGARVADVMQQVTALTADHRAGIPIPLRTGPHCSRCRALKNCPAQTALVRALPVGVVDLADSDDRLSPANIAETFRRVEEMKALLARVEAEIFGIAARETIDLGDGRLLGLTEGEREKFDGDMAFDLLSTWYSPEDARRAVKMSVSKESAKAVISARLQPKQKMQTKNGDGVFDRFVDALRARGGVRTETWSNVKVHSAKKGK